MNDSNSKLVKLTKEIPKNFMKLIEQKVIKVNEKFIKEDQIIQARSKKIN